MTIVVRVLPHRLGRVNGTAAMVGAVIVWLGIFGWGRLSAQQAPGTTTSGQAEQLSRTSASSAPTPPSTVSASIAQTLPSDDYVISPEDVLDVYVYDVPELSREYVVSTGGNVTVPLLAKPIPAAGLSPDQFARALERSFQDAGTLSRPQISVAVK